MRKAMPQPKTPNQKNNQLLLKRNPLWRKSQKRERLKKKKQKELHRWSWNTAAAASADAKARRIDHTHAAVASQSSAVSSLLVFSPS